MRSADKKIDVAETGFVVRQRTPVRALTTIFMGISGCVLLIACVFYYDNLNGFYMCLIAGLLMLFISRQLETMQRIQLSTEFTNALFSSAMAKGYKFCMIVSQAGDIIYCNRPFQAMFPAFSKQDKLTIEQWFLMQEGSSVQYQNVLSLLSVPSDSNVAVTLRGGENEAQQSMHLLIEPIEFPKGYVLIRGK